MSSREIEVDQQKGEIQTTERCMLCGMMRKSHELMEKK